MTVVKCGRCGHLATSSNFMCHACPGPHDHDDHAYVPEPGYQVSATPYEAMVYERARDARWRSRPR